jgi:hypothetical protein
MKTLRTFAQAAILGTLCAGLLPAGAQVVRAVPDLTLVQAERVAIELKQGMSLEDVRTLLGKPRRTVLKNEGTASSVTPQGALQWTYTWGSSHGPASLHVHFASKTTDAWFVNAWEWTTF